MPFHLRLAGQHLCHHLLGMLREHGGRRHMTGETAAMFIGRRIGLQPDTQHRAEDRRLQRRAMQECRINPAESLQVRRLLSHAFPFLVMPVVALFAIFRSNEDLFNLLHPGGWSRDSAFCAMA